MVVSSEWGLKGIAEWGMVFKHRNWRHGAHKDLWVLVPEMVEVRAATVFNLHGFPHTLRFLVTIRWIGWRKRVGSGIGPCMIDW